MILFAVVFGINLLPAFGPPTWSVLVLYRLNTHLNIVALVGLGAVAAASGRYVLALGSRALRGHLSEERRRSLDAARDALEAKRGRSIAGLGLFALSPVPSAQLFEAAGIAGVRLVPVVVAFFAGRVVSYGLYVSGASAVKSTSLGDSFRDSLTSPWGIALQLGMIAVVVLLARVDWTKHLPERSEPVPAATSGR